MRGLRDLLCQHITAELKSVHEDVMGRIDNIHKDFEIVQSWLSSIENVIGGNIAGRHHTAVVGNHNGDVH